MTFKHSGSAAEIIFAVPAIAALGGGVLYLDVSGGESEALVRENCARGRTGFGGAEYEMIRPLLLEQGCIEDVRVWGGENVDCNLDEFRGVKTVEALDVVGLHLRAAGILQGDATVPWLTVSGEALSVGKAVLLDRGARNHSRCFWWAAQLGRLLAEAAFIGGANEHEIFQYTFDCQVPRYEPKDALELARLLAGSKRLYANHTLSMAVAMGMGAAYTVEPYEYASPWCAAKVDGDHMHIVVDGPRVAAIGNVASASGEGTFKHSGDLGDIIYSLPAVKAMGGGILYLDVSGGAGDCDVQGKTIAGRMKFGRAAYETIRPLLMEQAYIRDVRVWAGEAVDCNLDQARKHIGARTNLAAAYLEAFGLDARLYNAPWLAVSGEAIRLDKPMIVNRTVRNQSKDHVWYADFPGLAAGSVFIGHPREHAIFQYTFDCKLNYYPAKDALEIARILMGSSMLIGNQSFVMSVAIGLGTAYNMEVCDYTPNCMFGRENGHVF